MNGLNIYELFAWSSDVSANSNAHEADMQLGNNISFLVGDVSAADRAFHTTRKKAKQWRIKIVIGGAPSINYFHTTSSYSYKWTRMKSAVREFVRS
jgi:hypothetical protein